MGKTELIEHIRSEPVQHYDRVVATPDSIPDLVAGIARYPCAIQPQCRVTNTGQCRLDNEVIQRDVLFAERHDHETATGYCREQNRDHLSRELTHRIRISGRRRNPPRGRSVIDPQHLQEIGLIRLPELSGGALENGNRQHGNFQFHGQRGFLRGARSSSHCEETFQRPHKRKTASLARFSTGSLQSPDLESLIIALIDAADDHSFDSSVDCVLSTARPDLLLRRVDNVPISRKVFRERTSSLTCAAADYHDVIVPGQLASGGLTEYDSFRRQAFRAAAYPNASLCEEPVS